MAEAMRIRLEAAVSPAHIWNIAVQCVLAAGGALTGQTPDPFAPLDHWILDEDGLVRYYGYLQNMLVAHGFNVGVDTDQPLGYDAIEDADFLVMIRAVSKRMLGR